MGIRSFILSGNFQGDRLEGGFGIEIYYQSFGVCYYILVEQMGETIQQWNK